MHAQRNLSLKFDVKVENTSTHVGYLLAEYINALSALATDLQAFWAVPSGVPCRRDHLTLMTLAVPSDSERVEGSPKL